MKNESFTFLQIKNKKYFRQNQKLLLKLANSKEGRYLLAVKENLPIVKITPSSIHLALDKKNILGKFYCYEMCAKVLLPIVTQLDIAKNVYGNETLAPYIYLTTTNYYAGSGDGLSAYDNTSSSWATTHDALDGTAAAAGGASSSRGVGSYKLSNSNFAIYRDFFPADTSSLTGNATITAATFNLSTDVEGTANENPVGVLVATTQAATTTVTTADYDQVGGTAFSSNTPTFSGSGYITFTMNATGIAALSKTGTTKMGVRNYTYDFLNVTPSDMNNRWCTIYFSEQSGTSQDPYYAITYTTQGGSFLLSMI